GVARAEVDQSVGELLDARTAADRLVVDADRGIGLGEILEPALIERRGKGRTGALKRDRPLRADAADVERADANAGRRCERWSDRSHAILLESSGSRVFGGQVTARSALARCPRQRWDARSRNILRKFTKASRSLALGLARWITNCGICAAAEEAQRS